MFSESLYVRLNVTDIIILDVEIDLNRNNKYAMFGVISMHNTARGFELVVIQILSGLKKEIE